MNYKVIFDDLISECYAMSDHALGSEDGDLCYLRNQLKDYLDQLLDDPENVDIFFLDCRYHAVSDLACLQ